MKLTQLAAALAAGLTLLTAQAQETLSHGRFTNVTLYRPHGAVKSFVLVLPLLPVMATTLMPNERR